MFDFVEAGAHAMHAYKDLLDPTKNMTEKGFGPLTCHLYLAVIGHADQPKHLPGLCGQYVVEVTMSLVPDLIH